MSGEDALQCQSENLIGALFGSQLVLLKLPPSGLSPFVTHMGKAKEEFKEHQAVKFTYDCEQAQWEQQPVRIRLDPAPFSEGGMRCLVATA